MPFESAKRIKQIDSAVLLFVPMLLFKLACDLGYWYLLTWNTKVFRADFNPVKYAVGLLWCIVLFFAIDHNRKKASSFLLLLFFLLQIVPITTIYALGNDNSVYYNTVCLATLLCELFVRYVDTDRQIIRAETLSTLMIVGFFALSVFTVVQMIRIYGKPSSTAMDIYKVYEMRANAKELGKLLNYLLEWTMAVFLPLWIAKSITDKKYLFTALLCGIMLLIYLYTGHKTYLFAVPMVVACSLWAGREDCHRELFFCFCFGFAILVVLCLIESDKDHGLFNQVFSLLGRRCMLDTANNKFKYFDYFSQRPRMGIYGIFPRWLVRINSYYADIPYTYEISRIYYQAPNMNSNTGFLAEGYMRFGHIGTFAALFLFGLILKLIDSFAQRTSYQLAVGFFSFAVFSLADAYLFSSLFFGPWMLMILILLFYSEKKEKTRENGALA